MAAPQGIVKIDLLNPSLSRLVIPAAGSGAVFGLASVPFTGNSNKYYEFAINGQTTDIIELDLDNNLKGARIGSLPFVVNDAASSVEDGSFLTLSIDNVSTKPDCPATGKGTIQVAGTSALGDITYTLNGVSNTTGIFTGLDPGSYNISASTGTETVQYANNPVIVTAFTVDKPTTTVIKVDPLCLKPGSISLNTAANSTSYTIKYNNGNYPFGHTFNGLAAGTHHFDILNTIGCIVDNLDIELTQTACEVITFPNTFSPNNDGINDTFGPSQTGVADNLKFRIYNRLGVLLFTSTKAPNGWDGRYKGKEVPWGVYYWTASYLNNEGKSVLQRGYITLIR